MYRLFTLLLISLLVACGGPEDPQEEPSMKRVDDQYPARASGPRGGGLIADHNISEEAVIRYALYAIPQNGDFENYPKGTLYAPEHWSIISGVAVWGTHLESYSTDSASGTRCLRFKPVASTVFFGTDKFPVVGGSYGFTSFRYNVLATGNSAFDDIIQLNVRFYDVNGTSISSLTSALADVPAYTYFGAVPSGWKSYSSPMYQAPATARFVDVYFSKGPGATMDVLVDNVRYTAEVPSPAFLPVSFSGTWANFGGTSSEAGYMRDPNGIVHLRGSVKSGAVPSTIFTLPAGYRPGKDESYVTISNNAIGRIDIIASTGAVSAALGNTAWIQLDGITFKAEK